MPKWLGDLILRAEKGIVPNKFGKLLMSNIPSVLSCWEEKLFWELEKKDSKRFKSLKIVQLSLGTVMYSKTWLLPQSREILLKLADTSISFSAEQNFKISCLEVTRKFGFLISKRSSVLMSSYTANY